MSMMQLHSSIWHLSGPNRVATPFTVWKETKNIELSIDNEILSK